MPEGDATFTATTTGGLHAPTADIERAACTGRTCTAMRGGVTISTGIMYGGIGSGGWPPQSSP